MRTEKATIFTGSSGLHAWINPWSGPGWHTAQLVPDGPFPVTTVSRDDIHRGTVIDGWRYPLPYKAAVDSPGQLHGWVVCEGTQQVGSPTLRRDQFDIVHKSGTHTVDPSLLLPITSAMRSMGIAKLRKKLNDSKIELGVALLEGREAVRMIADSLLKLARFIDRLRARDFLGAARALGVSSSTVRSGASFSEAWLSFMFGWKPLIDDIASYAELFQTLGDRAQVRASVKVSRDDMTETSGKWEFDVENYVRCSAQYQRYLLFASSYKISCYLGLENSFFRDLNRLGLANAASIGWAVVPWSFVLDWAIGIGDILSGLAADVGLTFISGSETFYQEGRTHYKMQSGTVKAIAGQKLVRSSFDPAFTPAKIVRFERKVLDSVPLSFVPYIKNPFDSFKVTTSVALLNQQRLK